LSRRKAREYAFKVIFQVDQVAAEPNQALHYLLADSGLAEKDIQFSEQLIEQTINNTEELDKIIASYSNEWTLERMPAVDRNIMRLAVCEIVLIKNVDPVIVIDEAIEIAKKYGNDTSPAYINAILDRILSNS
jgi:N utilization substance protein B